MGNGRNQGEQTGRQRASERRANAAKNANPFSTVSASKRRATQAARSGQSAARVSSKHESSLDQSMLADILAHPTKEVSEAELRQEYSYVTRDIRSMAILAASLIVLLVVLATVLPK